MAQQQFLINGPSDIRQYVFPVHALSPAVFPVPLGGEYP